MNLLTAVADFCVSYNTVWVAYSGGLDSHVLLTLCRECRDKHGFDLQAVHVNHGLHPHAIEWAAHCEQYCQKSTIPFHYRQLHLSSSGASVENEARKARYHVFSELIKPGDILLTAHHQDDQAETLLLQLLRGAGPKGLSAMPVIKPFGRGYHARPLLGFTRENLLAYAKSFELTWVEDSSNTNTELSRNFMRHEVLPLLKRSYPAVVSTLARSAAHCAEAQTLLEEFGAVLCLEAAGTEPQTLSASKLLALPYERQKLILRSWIYRRGFTLPNTSKLDAILRCVVKARWDRRPHLQWPGAEIRRHRDNIFILTPIMFHDADMHREWEVEQPLSLEGIGVLTAREMIGTGLHERIKKLTVRFRQGGEMLHLSGTQRKDLKKMFQHWQVVPWQRNRVPLLFHEEKLIGVVGYGYDPDYTAKQDEKGREIILLNSRTDCQLSLA